MDQIKKVLMELNSKKLFHVWCHPFKYPKTIYRGSFEISDKHYQEENYKSVSLLPHISKVVERVNYK